MKANSSEPDATRTGTRKKALVLGVVGLIALLLVAVAGFTFRTYTTNYAEEIANPLEQGLVKAGAVKLCSTGGTGREPSNDEPWYDTYLTWTKPRSEVEATLNQIAEQHQYRLTKASQTNRGYVTVGDQYIDNWYFENSGKDSPYSDLEPGKVELSFVLYDDPKLAPTTACNREKSPITVDANHTFIGIQVRLPNVRR